MDIQPRGLFPAIALHRAVKLPAVTLIKRGVVSNKVKCADSACVHICQQRPAMPWQRTSGSV